jgi:hypothetical protein
MAASIIRLGRHPPHSQFHPCPSSPLEAGTGPLRGSSRKGMSAWWIGGSAIRGGNECTSRLMYCFDTPSEAARCSWMGRVVGSCSRQSQTACFIARDCSAVCLRGARARFLRHARSHAAVGRHQRLLGKSHSTSKSLPPFSLPTAFSHSLLSTVTGHKTAETQVTQRVASGIDYSGSSQ